MGKKHASQYANFGSLQVTVSQLVIIQNMLEKALEHLLKGHSVKVIDLCFERVDDRHIRFYRQFLRLLPNFFSGRNQGGSKQFP